MKIKPQKFPRNSEPINSPQYPSFSIALENFPDAKDWRVGKKYKISLVVRQTSISQYKDESGSVGFEILEIEGNSYNDKNEKIKKPNYSRL